MLASGIGTLSYGLSETSDSLFGVNPLKSFIVDTLGFSEDTYHLFGLVSGMASMAGMEAAGPFMNSGASTNKSAGITQKLSNKGIKYNPKSNPNKPIPRIEREPLERPLAGDNMGNLLKGLNDKGVSNPAHNAAQYDKLKTYYQQAEKYGTGSINELSDGRFRFYEEIKQARTQGEMAGARHVREWNSQTGAKRDWYETLDHSGNIRQVRPSPDITGGVKVHYMFDANGKYTGSWSPKK